MNKIKKFITSNYKKLSAFTLSAFLMLTMSVPAFAAGINDSSIVKGTEKLIGDVTTWLMILSPIVAIMLIIYFWIRRSAADEMDQKKWNTRIIAAIVSCVAAIVSAATLNLIIGYYK
jgi:heme/copper-type cytochrome/quinol oxidase subunit 2